MNKAKQCAALVDRAQMHARYTQGCKRSRYHAVMQQQCQQRAQQLYDELRRESRITQGRLPYKEN